MAFSLYSQERSEIKQKLLFLCSIIDVFTNPSGGILNSCLISTKLYRCYFFTPMFHIFVEQRAQIISREAHHPKGPIKHRHKEFKCLEVGEIMIFCVIKFPISNVQSMRQNAMLHH